MVTKSSVNRWVSSGPIQRDAILIDHVLWGQREPLYQDFAGILRGQTLSMHATKAWSAHTYLANSAVHGRLTTAPTVSLAVLKITIRFIDGGKIAHFSRFAGVAVTHLYLSVMNKFLSCRSACRRLALTPDELGDPSVFDIEPVCLWVEFVVAADSSRCVAVEPESAWPDSDSAVLKMYMP